MEEGEEDLHKPLLTVSPSSSAESDGFRKRTGTVWSSIAHIITAVIGSGVLSLAWSVAQLGWIAGPLVLLVFAGITLISSTLLCDCYRSPDPEHGLIRNRTYMDAVKLNLGKRSVLLCGILQQISLYGTGIAYTITSSISMRAIQRSNCFHKEGHHASCSYGNSFYMLLFGAIQIVFSQVPNFHDMVWLSYVAAIMSFSYSSIGFSLGLAKVIGNGRIKGSIYGVPEATPAQKVWRVSQALGDIAFAYPFSIILFEIQDTLKSPPPENQTMKKASRIAISITTFFYLCCGCFGYAAFGDNAPGNLLTGFGFYEPYWLVDLANAGVIIHLVGGYQVFSQQVFAFTEKWLLEKLPNSEFANKLYTIQVPLLPTCKMNLLRLCFRTAYVISTTWIAMLFPYFNQFLGVKGALIFWPMVVYFPVKMYIVQKKVGAWTRKWVVLQIFTSICLIVSVVAFYGSVEGLLREKFS